MTDPRMERDLREVLGMDAPDGAPTSLRERVRADLARESTGRGRAPWLAAAAAALIVVLGTIVVVGPYLAPPAGSPSPGASASHPIGTRSAETPFATVVPTIPTLPEPITDPDLIGGNVDPVTAAFGIATTRDGMVLVTNTNGATWRDVTPDGSRNTEIDYAEGLDPLHLRLVTSNDNQRFPLLWTSADSGQSWTSFDIPNRRSFGGITFLDPEVAWALDISPRGLDPEIAWTSDGGQTWSDLVDVVPPDGFIYGSMSFLTRQIGFLNALDANQASTTFRTTNGGTTWAPVELPAAPDALGQLVSGGIRFWDRTHGALTRTARTYEDYRLTLHRRVYTTADAGATWTYRFTLEMEGRWTLERLDDQTWIAIDGTERRMTTDGGRTWQVDDVAGLPDPAEYVSAEFVDADHGWAGSAHACLADFCTLMLAEYFKTTDGGLTWRPLVAK